ncbi:MAG TPA: MFS transporter [Verrucomicrobiae bacterium]|nr:MFS transporter [Verrucomicrobiae bacterium]
MSATLDSARKKAYWRLLPILFTCYVIAFVDRTNVAIAKLTMSRDLPGFNDAVIGTAAGMFFLGYFLLEIPGSLIVERWSARKWICRIMITWGFMAALTAAVKTPFQFYSVRFLLGLSEAGFFPGVIVFLSHWFTSRDRARALATFVVATPVAEVISPKVSNFLLKIGATEIINGVPVHRPEVLGLEGWQWIYIFWGLPAVLLGIVVLLWLPDRPHQAKWLSNEEAAALEQELSEERARVQAAGPRMSVLEALRHPKVLLLALAYFLTVTGSYGVQFFMPSILRDWYHLEFNKLTWLLILPPLVAVGGSMFAGWSSDHFRERRLHVVVPIAIGASALALMPSTQGNLMLTVICFMVAYLGFKSYIPVFWTLPSLLLTEAAAAGSIGLINSIGNLGGFLGPHLLGRLKTASDSFVGGLYCLSVSMFLSATLVFLLGLGKRR